MNLEQALRALGQQDMAALIVIEKHLSALAPKPRAKRVKHEEYTQQPYTGAKPIKHSDKPCNVDGIKYQPKWAWSADYRRHFRAALTCKRSKREIESINRAYMSWYRNTPGTTYNQEA